MASATGPNVNNDVDDSADPPRRRLRLDSLDRVRRELVKIYRQGRDGDRDVSDASKLANILTMIARILEGSDLEKRITALEQQRDRS
jgi:hypothetical protein